MSHFTVFVIGEDPESQLAPYEEELEVEFHSVEEEYLKEYNTDSATITLNTHDNTWQFEHGDDLDYGITLTFTQIYSSFEEFMRGWHGYKARDEKHGVYGYYTNPNAKWDWYQLGGRWTGFFLGKPELQYPAASGKAGLMTEDAPGGYYDSIRKGDIDLEKMYEIAVSEADAEYTEFENRTSGIEPLRETWAEIRDRFPDIDSARKFYNTHPWIKAATNGHFFNAEPFTYFEVDTGGREVFIERKRKKCISTFAVLHNGVWYERGEMGWFGMVSDEKDHDTWLDEFYNVFNSLPDDTLISAYDCHI